MSTNGAGNWSPAEWSRRQIGNGGGSRPIAPVALGPAPCCACDRWSGARQRHAVSWSAIHNSRCGSRFEWMAVQVFGQKGELKLSSTEIHPQC